MFERFILSRKVKSAIVKSLNKKTSELVFKRQKKKKKEKKSHEFLNLRSQKHLKLHNNVLYKHF